MADNMIRVLINITSDYYQNPAYFWERLRHVAGLYREANLEEILITVSYKHLKPRITREQVDHFREALRIFPNIAVIHARGVEWNRHDAELRGMGIAIYEGGIP